MNNFKVGNWVGINNLSSSQSQVRQILKEPIKEEEILTYNNISYGLVPDLIVKKEQEKIERVIDNSNQVNHKCENCGTQDQIDLFVSFNKYLCLSCAKLLEKEKFNKKKNYFCILVIILFFLFLLIGLFLGGLQ